MAKALSTARVSPTRQIHRALLPALVAFVLLSVFLAFWNLVVRAPALNYGAPSATHFNVPSAAAGEEIALCFDEVTWLRLCPGDLVTWLTPANVASRDARRIDLDTHHIATPQRGGRIAPKCRPFRVPSAASPGIWKLEGYARNFCEPFGVEVGTPLPSTTLIVKH